MNGGIGRELKVSELKERTVVVVTKEGRVDKDGIPFGVTMWVIGVSDTLVHFRAGKINTEFFALRTGPDLEQITDDSHIPMKIYEYPGKI